MMENDEAWGRWYDPEEERARLQQSYIDFARKQGYKEGYAEGYQEGLEQFIVYNVPYNVPIDVDTRRRRYPTKWTLQKGIKSLKVNT